MGNNVWVSVDCANAEEQERFFSMLGEGGEIRMPLQDTFWGAHFGMLTGPLWRALECSTATSHSKPQTGEPAGRSKHREATPASCI